MPMVLEHALRNGMEWRQRIRLEQQQEEEELNSLIIAATFTNEFGLQLEVGHVEESPMEGRCSISDHDIDSF